MHSIPQFTFALKIIDFENSIFSEYYEKIQETMRLGLEYVHLYAIRRMFDFKSRVISHLQKFLTYKINDKYLLQYVLSSD